MKPRYRNIALQDHEAVLSLNLRDADLKELAACGFDDPREGLQHCLDTSSSTLVIEDENEKIVGVFGVRYDFNMALPHKIGFPWMLTEQAIGKFLVKFIREARKVVASMLEPCDYLTNFTWIEHKESIKLLKLLGFEFEDNTKKVNDLDFVRFYKYNV